MVGKETLQKALQQNCLNGTIHLAGETVAADLAMEEGKSQPIFYKTTNFFSRQSCSFQNNLKQ